MTEAALTADGWLRFNGGMFRAAFGQAGLTDHKQEGDHATPRGLLPLRRVLYRADRIPPPCCLVPVEPIAPDDGWCDDPAHADYNRMIRLPHPAWRRPARRRPARHETLWRDDALYDVLAVLGWNDAPVVPQCGSAIFLHLARPDYAPTEGCIAVSRPDLLSLLTEGLTVIRAG